MDNQSWLCGYLTGVRLHGHLHAFGMRPSVVASMSVTGIAADFDWYADLSGVAALTAVSAEYAGDVSVSYSRDGGAYSAPTALPELLAVNPAKLFAGAASLWFRFHLADDNADLSSFTLLGVLERDLPFAAGRSGLYGL